MARQRLVLIIGFFLTINLTSLAQVNAGHSLKDIDLLSQKLIAGLSSDEEKFSAIYKWVCTNIATDIELVEIHRAKRKELSGEELTKWNREMNDRMVKTLIDDHKTLCTGYAWLVKELSRRAGIRCEIINGYGRRMGSNVNSPAFANHSWNAVLLNGRWHLCDPAWSAGVIDLTTQTFKFKFEDAYFLTDPEYFIRNHYPLDTAWAFVDHVPDLDQFLNDVVIYPGTIKHKISPTGAYRTEIRKGETVFDRKFKRRGTYPVHIFIGDDVVASYEVIVR